MSWHSKNIILYLGNHKDLLNMFSEYKHISKNVLHVLNKILFSYSIFTFHPTHFQKI